MSLVIRRIHDERGTEYRAPVATVGYEIVRSARTRAADTRYVSFARARRPMYLGGLIVLSAIIIIGVIEGSASSKWVCCMGFVTAIWALTWSIQAWFGGTPAMLRDPALAIGEARVRIDGEGIHGEVGDTWTTIATLTSVRTVERRSIAPGRFCVEVALEDGARAVVLDDLDEQESLELEAIVREQLVQRAAHT